MARGLCALDPALALKLSAAQRGVISCLASPCAVTLPSKVACLSRWRHAPLQEWAGERGPNDIVRIPACRPVPAGRQFPRDWKPVLRKPLQVQHARMLRLIF